MKKHYPPAYYKYKAKHATVSVLLSKTTKEALDKARGKMSYSEFIKSLLSDDGLFFELQKQKAKIQAESKEQKIKLQNLKADINNEKKELAAERQKIKQEKVDLYQNGYSKGKKDGYLEGEGAGYANGLTAGGDKQYKNGYSEGEKAGFTKGHTAGKDEGYKTGASEGKKAGIEKGRKEGRMFYLGFCPGCGEKVLWDLNDPKYVNMLKEILKSSKGKLYHEECKEKHPNYEYLGTPDFIPYLPETKKA